MERMQKDGKIIQMIENGRLDELDALFGNEAAFDVNAPLNNYWTALLHACDSDQYDVVDMLLANKADINQHVNGITALMLACSSRSDPFKTVQLLLHKNALVNVSDSIGKTPLMFACDRGHLDVVNVLLPLASVDAVDNEGSTVSKLFFMSLIKINTCDFD